MATTRLHERQPRDVTINLRANQRQRTLIDRAAQVLGKNRSDFMLEAACRSTGGSSCWTSGRTSASPRHSINRPPTIRGCAACWLRECPGSDDRRKG